MLSAQESRLVNHKWRRLVSTVIVIGCYCLSLPFCSNNQQVVRMDIRASAGSYFAVAVRLLRIYVAFPITVKGLIVTCLATPSNIAFFLT